MEESSMKKITVIVGTAASAIVLLAGGSVYYWSGHSNQNNKNADSVRNISSPKHSTSKMASHSSAISNNILNASGTDYGIRLAGGVGGVFAKPTPMNKIFDRAAALDIVASVPTFNHSKLVSISRKGDDWHVVVLQDGLTSDFDITHYQGILGLIQLTQSGKTTQYGMNIPESYYAPYKEAEQKANAAFSSSISSQQTDVDTISLEEGIALIKKAGSEAASNDSEIISSTDHSITIGSEVGAKGYDKTTLTPNNDGTVHIYQEYGTLDGGTYSILDYMPAKEFNVPR
ncbi:hypothetical protein [Leuconostoc gasicomitatum]|uniref:hypothetical protein n=1 Tax=Leuconostoc gasicomitatum TaxID=115778 RepID=UPI001CC74294|nr:hypothetical protein [Leuconostoc gasicomitatum]MBZ5949828.1 hypothetical protein [Leuconostoc gasicomitatum]